MMKPKNYVSGLLYMLITAILLTGTSACYVERAPAQKPHPKKPHPHHHHHPHGGPPGQTKKPHGHPGKRH